jgi:hypothetical protein
MDQPRRGARLVERGALHLDGLLVGTDAIQCAMGGSRRSPSVASPSKRVAFIFV